MWKSSVIYQNEVEPIYIDGEEVVDSKNDNAPSLGPAIAEISELR